MVAGCSPARRASALGRIAPCRLTMSRHCVSASRNSTPAPARRAGTLRDSGLDWPAIRPPRLTDGPVTGTYRTAEDRSLRRGVLISRADVAHLMLRVLDRPETIGHAIGIAH